MKDEFENMDGEYGKQPEENFKQPPEKIDYPETKTYKEEEDEPEEIKAYSEEVHRAQNPQTKAKKKKSKLTRVLRSAAMLVATVALVTIVAPDIISRDKTSVDFAEMVIKDTSVDYFITFENWSGKEYDIVLYNDFTKRTITINSGSATDADDVTATSQITIDGSEVTIYNREKELKSGTTYTLAVKRGYKTVAKTSFRTLRADEMAVTKLNGVTPKCNCSHDGNFQFIMDFIDGNGWWTDFKATLTDSEGHVSECTFDYSDLTGLQVIPVRNVDTEVQYLTGTTATLVITCTSYENYEDTGETEEIVLYNEEVEI